MNLCPGFSRALGMFQNSFPFLAISSVLLSTTFLICRSTHTFTPLSSPGVPALERLATRLEACEAGECCRCESSTASPPIPNTANQASFIWDDGCLLNGRTRPREVQTSNVGMQSKLNRPDVSQITMNALARRKPYGCSPQRLTGGDKQCSAIGRPVIDARWRMQLRHGDCGVSGCQTKSTYRACAAK